MIKIDSAKKETSILIGAKPFIHYVKAMQKELGKTGSAKQIIIKARGKFISKAVDVAEIGKKKLPAETAKVRQIKIDTENFTTPDGKKVSVSTIEIAVGK